MQKPNIRRLHRLNQRGFDHVLVAVAFVVLVGVIGTAMVVSSHAASLTWSGELQNGYDRSLCMNDSNSSRTSKTPISIYACGSAVSEKWTIAKNSDSEFLLKNGQGICADDKGDGVGTTPLQTYTCNGADHAQLWKWNGHELENVYSKGCINDPGSSKTNGTQLHVASCSDPGSEQWFEAAQSSSSGGSTGSSACGPSGQCVPVGNISGWKQIFETNFPGTVPLGAFSGCTSDNDGTEASAYCTGLKSYSSYYTNWWAYPSGWPDTAEECIEGDSACPDPGLSIPIGGDYEPQESVSVNGSEMHIHMYRPSSGNNVVATVIPRACMNMKYGRYTERFEVTGGSTGFKSAHLFYQGGFEIDYPENDYGTTISAYTHPGGANFSTNAKWNSWHTTVIEWTASSVKFYMDGTLIGTTTTDIPNIPMSWILQNESSILGPYASPGASTQLNLAWVACYAAAS